MVIDTRADVLVVMARAPRLGRVKTRLAAAVGAERALALYGALLGDIAARFVARHFEIVWAVDPPGCDLAPFVADVSRRIDQRGSELGERMGNCFGDLFAAGAQSVVMIGADAPHLADARIDAAFAALATDDAVFAPTRDGGYCLVGLTAPHDLFSIRMGTADVLRQTLAQADALGLRVALQEPTFDVDELGDAALLASAIEAKTAPPLPRTAAVLRAWRKAGLFDTVG